jgi:hypothetical protein
VVPAGFDELPTWSPRRLSFRLLRQQLFLLVCQFITNVDRWELSLATGEGNFSNVGESRETVTLTANGVGYKGATLQRRANRWDQISSKARLCDVAECPDMKSSSDIILIFVDSQKYGLGSTMSLL